MNTGRIRPSEASTFGGQQGEGLGSETWALSVLADALPMNYVSNLG